MSRSQEVLNLLENVRRWHATADDATRAYNKLTQIMHRLDVADTRLVEEMERLGVSRDDYLAYKAEWDRGRMTDIDRVMEESPVPESDAALALAVEAAQLDIDALIAPQRSGWADWAAQLEETPVAVEPAVATPVAVEPALATPAVEAPPKHVCTHVCTHPKAFPHHLTAFWQTHN